MRTVHLYCHVHRPQGKFAAEYPGSERVRSNLHVATKFAAYPWRVMPVSRTQSYTQLENRNHSETIATLVTYSTGLHAPLLPHSKDTVQWESIVIPPAVRCMGAAGEHRVGSTG